METEIAPLAIGTKFYVAAVQREGRTRDCPDCLGEKVFKVIAPSGDEFTLECPRCSNNTWVRDVPSLRYEVCAPKVHEDEIKGFCINEYGEQGIRYRGGHYSIKAGEIILDRDVADQKAKLMAAEENAKYEAEPQRIHHKNLCSLKLREATLETFKNGLYDSWSAFRHLRELVDEIISNDAHEFGSRSDIVEALESKLQDTHRYEFVFEGFTRAMEAVVALVNASEPEEEVVILDALRKLWRALPEQAQDAWKPNERIATDWSGKPCPTY